MEDYSAMTTWKTNRLKITYIFNFKMNMLIVNNETDINKLLENNI